MATMANGRVSPALGSSGFTLFSKEYTSVHTDQHDTDKKKLFGGKISIYYTYLGLYDLLHNST